MASIPVIDQTTTASGGGGPNYLTAPQATNGFAQGAQALGQGMDALAQGETDLRNAQLRAARVQEHQDAAVWAGNALSDAQLKWQQALKDAQDNAQPGAPGFTPSILGQFDAWAKDALGKAPNPTSQRFLAEHLAGLRTSIGSNAINFEAQARTDNRIATIGDSTDKVAQVVMGDPTPDTFKQTYAQQKAIIDALEVPPEVRQKLTDQLRDKALTGYWLGRIRRDPEGAAQELRQGLGPSSVEMLRGWGPGTAQGVTSGLWSAVVQQESGGNQAAVSPAGAVGVAQVMPATGPEAAQLAGLPWDENRLRTDPAYNQALGQAYLGAQLKTFGNVPQALAAYNAGPGAVQKAVQKAAASGGDWLSYLPKETQDYVARISARAGGQPVVLNDAAGGLPGSTTPPAPSGNSVLDATPMNIRLQMMQHADSEISRTQAVYRSQIGSVEADQVAAYMNGAPVARPLTQTDYVRAYGPLEGLQRFENYQQIAAMGGDINALKVAPPAAVQATLAKYQPDPAKPNYDAQVKRYEIVAKAVDAVNQQRQADPIQYAIQTGIGEAHQLPMNDPNAFAAELSKRAGLAATMQDTYGTPYSVLTKAEASTLSQGFQGMTAQQKLGYLSTIRHAVTDPQAYRTVLQQIAPDSPVTALAGAVLSAPQPVTVSPMLWGSPQVFQPQDVASRMLEGEALLNPSKAARGADGKGREFPMPKDADMRTQFVSVVGKAFQGDPLAADVAMQGVKAYYAGQAARDGDVSGILDSGRLKDAITAVVGGISDVNGKGETIRPWGMDDGTFRNRLSAAFAQQMQATGLKGTVVDNFGAYGVQQVRDGQYLLRAGTGYLTDKAGNPVVLNVGTQVSDRMVTGQVQPAPTMQPVGTVVPAKTVKMDTQLPRTK